MSFMKAIFGRNKKSKEEPQEKESRNFKRDQTRRSMHIDDRSFGPSNLPSFYQSVGKKYPKGPLSCPGGGDYRDGDDDSIGARTDFNPSYSHKRRSGGESSRMRQRGILVHRRDDNNSDFSSQGDHSPVSHFSRHQRTRHYDANLDDSDEENNFFFEDRIREKMRKHEEERQSYIRLIKMLRKDKKDLQKQLSQQTDTITDLKKELKEYKDREMQRHWEWNREAMYRNMYMGGPPQPSMAPPPPFYPNPSINPFMRTRAPSDIGTDPSTSIIDSTPDGARESLCDPLDDSYRPHYDNSRIEGMTPESAPFSFPFPSTFAETPRSNEHNSTLHQSNSSIHQPMNDSSFRPPLPPTMPPRGRKYGSESDISPRRRQHSM